MAESFKYGNGVWATKTGSSLAYNDENDNYKPLPFSVTRDSIATRVNKEGLIEVVGKDKLRIDYTDSTKGVALLEPARTNLVTNSEQFVDAPTGNTNMDLFSGTITNNNTTSPDGNTKGMKFTISSGSGAVLRIYQSDLSTSANTTFSIYAKKGTTDSLSINIAGGTATIATLTDEWQRFSTTDTSSGSKFLDVEISGSAGEYIYIFGIQAELGSYATSYIPTSGSAVPRAADVANGAGNSEVFNDSEGVLFADIAALAEESSSRYFSLNDGSTSNRIRFGYTTPTNSVRLLIIASTSQVDITEQLSKTSIFNKIAIKYKQNDFALWADGFEIATHTSGNTPSGLSQLDFDNAAGTDNFYGKAKRIGVYDAVLTDAELEALTSYTSFINMANELNLTIK